jgi:hypothetical protein
MSSEPEYTGVDQKVQRIHGLLEGRTHRGREAEILALLDGASPGDLDPILLRLDLVRLIGDVDDRLFGPDNRAALFRLLCEERLGDLSIAARARLVAALQRGRTCADDERAIAAIFRGTRGAALTEMKNTIDGAAQDHRDLQQLVFRDIDDDKLRDDILAHLQAEAAPRADLKILSDIDDTLYRNWKDARYPKTHNPETDKPYLYPGVRAFYHELDVAFGGGEPGDLTFLTARPGDRAGIGEGITRGHLAALGLSYARVTTGDLPSLVTHERMAARKYQGFVELQRLFPEYRFVFSGDSGQGDAIAGRKMMKHPSGRMLAVFIHDVIATAPAEREEQRSHGVLFHDTYAGAAVEAHALGLLDPAALRRVAEATIADMWAFPFTDAAQREARLTDLRADIARVNAQLPAGERLAV